MISSSQQIQIQVLFSTSNAALIEALIFSPISFLMILYPEW